MIKRGLNDAGSIRVCIDNYDNGELSGRLYEASDAEAVEFTNAIALVKLMQDIFDTRNFPQATMKQRSFKQRRQPVLPEEVATDEPKLTKPSAIWTAVKGKAATFRVRVIFRQNASWQGSVTWLEESRDESFRSALELLMLIDSAFGDGDCLTGSQPETDDNMVYASAQG